MTLSREEVKKIAQLARLELTETEIDRYAGELSRILDYVAQLGEVKTEGVEPTAQVTGLLNIMRDDEVRGCETDIRVRLLSSVPQREGDLVKTLPVFS